MQARWETACNLYDCNKLDVIENELTQNRQQTHDK